MGDIPEASIKGAECECGLEIRKQQTSSDQELERVKLTRGIDLPMQRMLSTEQQTFTSGKQPNLVFPSSHFGDGSEV